MAYKVGDIIRINGCPNDISGEQWNQEIKGQHFRIYRKTNYQGSTHWRLAHIGNPERKLRWADEDNKIIDWVEHWFEDPEPFMRDVCQAMAGVKHDK